MGLLGAMSGAGKGMGGIGQTMFESAMTEDRAKRVAEHKADLSRQSQDEKNKVLKVSENQDVLERQEDGSYKKVYENQKEASPEKGQETQRKLENDAWGRASKAFGSMSNGMLKLDGPDKEKAAWTADRTIKIMQDKNVGMNEAFLTALADAETNGIMTASEAESAARQSQMDKYKEEHPVKAFFGGSPDTGGAAEASDTYKEKLGLVNKSPELKPSYKHPSGKTVTRDQIEDTARNRGMTPEEVIKTLGLQ